MNHLPMNHLNDEQLIDHYYGESEHPAETATHLRECGDCARAYSTLVRDLSEIAPLTPPARGADYGAQVWQSIRNSVPVYEQKKRTWFRLNLWTGFSYATACIVLLAATFFAGRQWEHHTNPQLPVAVATNNDQGRQRVVLLVLGDHLDRSERLLVQLNHGESAEGAPLQAEARDLLAANRLYRKSVAQSDPTLANALDHLERVLIEVANQPGGLTPARLDQLQKEMNTDGLLFEVRVLRSRVQGDTEPKQSQPSTKGVSI